MPRHSFGLAQINRDQFVISGGKTGPSTFSARVDLFSGIEEGFASFWDFPSSLPSTGISQHCSFHMVDSSIGLTGGKAVNGTSLRQFHALDVGTGEWKQYPGNLSDQIYVCIFVTSCCPTRDHIGRSTRNSNPVLSLIHI